MNNTLRTILLISAILAATPLVLSSVFWVFPFAYSLFTEKESGFQTLLLVSSFLMRILGYTGLWRNLIFNDNRKRNSVLLVIGIIGTGIFMILAGGGQMMDWFNQLDKPFWILILWPPIVSIIILVSNILKLQNLNNEHQNAMPLK